jgi:hypothetical protein
VKAKTDHPLRLMTIPDQSPMRETANAEISEYPPAFAILLRIGNVQNPDRITMSA